MPIDPSIIPLRQTQPNFGAIGETANQILGIQRGLLQLRQAQQQQAANAAATQAFQQSTDEQGNINVPLALQKLASNPAAGMYLPQFASQLQSLQNSQLTGQNLQLEGQRKRLDYLDSQLGSIVNKKDLGINDVLGVLSGAVQNKIMDVPMAQSYLADAPKDDPAALRDWVKQHYLGLMDIKSQLQATMPQTQVVNTGGATNILNIDPLTGQPRIGGTLLNSMSPAEAATPVQLTTPEGTPYAITKGQFAGQAMGMGQPGMGGGMQQSSVPMGGMQTGLSPAEQASQAEGARVVAQTAANNANAMHQSVVDAPVRLNYLQDALNIVRDPKSMLGPGAAPINQMKGIISTLAPDVAKSLGYSDQATSAQEFKKIMANYASQVSGNLGTGTDARLNSAIMGNANPDMGKQANENILVKTIAAERMRQAMDQDWQNSGINLSQPQKFNQWQSQWLKNADPAVFAFPYMSGKQQDDFLSKMSKQQQQKFQQDIQNSYLRGWLKQ